jgi:hypothetical protein
MTHEEEAMRAFDAQAKQALAELADRLSAFGASDDERGVAITLAEHEIALLRSRYWATIRNIEELEARVRRSLH